MISLKGLVVCLLLLCFQSAQGKCTRMNEIDEFIISGLPQANIITYLASIQLKDKGFWGHYCGGALITVQHVLTAATCLTEPEKKIKVRVGSHTGHALGQTSKVLSIRKHPRFTEARSHLFNIGIIKTKKIFTLSENVTLINFRSKKFYPAGELVWVSGYGSVDWNNIAYPEIVYSLSERTISNKDCKKSWKTIDDKIICASAGDNQGLGLGDLGGPLVNADKKELVGIVANISQKGYPDVYTRISSYVDWIEDTIHPPPKYVYCSSRLNSKQLKTQKSF